MLLVMTIGGLIGMMIVSSLIYTGMKAWEMISANDVVIVENYKQ